MRSGESGAADLGLVDEAVAVRIPLVEQLAHAGRTPREQITHLLQGEVLHRRRRRRRRWPLGAGGGFERLRAAALPVEMRQLLARYRRGLHTRAPRRPAHGQSDHTGRRPLIEQQQSVTDGL